jgi:type IV pilus assembly protein PilV
VIMKNYSHPMSPILRARRVRARGFSLLEVLIALLVISFGLLGVAGMQAVSVSNTSVAGMRSIAAMQANSMASAMEANEKFWAKSTANSCTAVTGTVGGTAANATLSLGTYSGATICTGTPLSTTATICLTSGAVCTSTILAESDMQAWGAALANALPGGIGEVDCLYTVGQPVSCTIVVQWAEKLLAKDQAAGVAATAHSTFDYQMMVEP